MARYERKDAFHQRAKREGFRSRAAYKLQEMQGAHRVLRAGQRVVDLGCWPGGWLQVAAAEVGSAGRVVGVDLAKVDPPLELANVFALVGDLTEGPVQKEILERLGGPADVLLSDAAPKLTGVRATDRAREEALLEAIETAAPALLATGGSLLVKLLDCPEAQAFQERVRGRVASVRVLKPRASRKGTTERYLLGRGWKG
ncbi:MAG: 23S rRNA (uridine(2552)-2'-O)-methyltransferase [Deltaproteobacteria bacterium]|jgi:23S rRNA (uridine2552-2'-O)-methyltransferase|nr:23S rRNA (uridine(2552)-2'-O)-methyltransferase [Deltaproteobacteria bacterium]